MPLELSQANAVGIMVLQTAPQAFYSMGTLSSETGVQQGDPLGPLFFCLVLQKLVGTTATDEVSSHLLYHKWYMDDGAVAGSEKAVARVITILSELGPQLGLCSMFLNASFFPRET